VGESAGETVDSWFRV